MSLLTDQCDFCGKKAFSFTAACGFHKVCVRCNVTRKATSMCTACLGYSAVGEVNGSDSDNSDDEFSDLDGNNDKIEAMLNPPTRKVPWITTNNAKRQSRVSRMVQTNILTTPPEYQLPASNVKTLKNKDQKAPPGTPRTARKPRRLQGQVVSQMKVNPKVPAVPRSEREPARPTDAPSTDAWRVKAPGAIMYSELRGVPALYDVRRQGTSFETQSFRNLNERCRVLWRESTGHSPPSDPTDADKTPVGQGDVTNEDSDTRIGYLELEASDDDDDESEILESPSLSACTEERPLSERELKANRVSYNRCWVVHDGSEDSLSDEREVGDGLEVEGPGFCSDSDEDDGFWVTQDRLVRRGYVA